MTKYYVFENDRLVKVENQALSYLYRDGKWQEHSLFAAIVAGLTNGTKFREITEAQAEILKKNMDA